MSVVHGPVAAPYRTVVVERWPGRFHLCECLALRDEILNAVTNDREHVAILDDVCLVGEPAVARDHIRPAFLLVLRDREVEDAVEAVDDAVHAAAVLRINDRIGRGQ